VGMNNPPYIPGIFMGKLVADKCAKAEIEKKVYADMLKDSDLTKVVGKIKVPTLIIWGAKDKILHIDNAELFHQKIKGSYFDY